MNAHLPTATRRSHKSTYLMAAVGVVLTSLMVLYPDDSFRASLEGLRVWWQIVFPALLPFFIAAEMLMGLGVVHALGALFEPLMRPVFNVPGVGAFAMAMGLASGYPIGAKITGSLRRKGLCTRVEAERLISITNTADPLFMVGAVAVGMFGRPYLGIVIALSHYFASIALGILLRFYGTAEDGWPKKIEARRHRINIVRRAARELVLAREADGRSFGQLLGDSVRDSVMTLLVIGGFIVIFSVVTKVMAIVGLTGAIAAPFALVLRPFGISPSLVDSLVRGFFEITIGCEAAARASAPLADRVIIASVVIAWSGLSVHAQAASMVNGTDIRMGPYLSARVVHAIFAAGFSAFLLGPLSPVAHSMATGVAATDFYSLTPGQILIRSGVTLVAALSFLAVVGAVILVIRGPRLIIFKASRRKP